MGPIFEKNQATTVYKDHTITLQVSLSPDLKKFVPMAAISWKTDGRLILYFLRSNKECSTGDDANNMALEEAKLWVDHHELDLVKS
jgi:hypothetical protein